MKDIIASQEIPHSPLQNSPVNKKGQISQVRTGNCHSLVARLGPSNIPVTGSSYEAPARRAGTFMETD